MGINYYAEVGKCECCGQYTWRLHIGKYSIGNPFMFRLYKSKDIPDAIWEANGLDPFDVGTLAEWREFLTPQDCSIVDEYDRPITDDDFFKMIDAIPESWFDYKMDPELLRFTIHMGDNWMTIEGEFS
jgi:hypothetical protein